MKVGLERGSLPWARGGHQRRGFGDRNAFLTPRLPDVSLGPRRSGPEGVAPRELRATVGVCWSSQAASKDMSLLEDELSDVEYVSLLLESFHRSGDYMKVTTEYPLLMK
jgi:hypothetical protein